MRTAELQLLRENRLEGETVNETRARLAKEGKFYDPEPEAAEEKAIQEEHLANDPVFGDDLPIPRWKVVQPQCRIEGATQGTFRNMLTEEEVSKLEDVVFLTQQNTRSLFVKDDFSGAKRCWSYNGYFPAQNQIIAKTGNEPMAPVCASRENGKLVFHCPHAEWRNQRGEIDPKGNIPPACKGSIGFLGVDVMSHMPFWCVFHGTAIPEIKDFLRYINYKREESRRQGKNLQLFDFKLTLGLTLQTTPKGKFYVPVFEKKEEITDPEERVLLRKCYESLHGRFMVEPVAQEQTAAE